MDRESAADVASSLETYFNPAVWTGEAAARVADALAHRRLVVVRHALRDTFAERVFRDLDAATDWTLHDSYGRRGDSDDPFNFHHHNICEPQPFPPDLARCRSVFAAGATRALIRRLSGRACDGATSVSASWYQPGDHSLPHDDRVATRGEMRQVGFVWHLTKDWRPEWGGALYWCRAARYLPPTFNTLLLFLVGSGSEHFVTQVSPHAQAKRLAVNGWWQGADDGDADEAPDATAAAIDVEEI